MALRVKPGVRVVSERRIAGCISALVRARGLLWLLKKDLSILVTLRKVMNE